GSKGKKGDRSTPPRVSYCEHRASRSPASAMREPIELHLNEAPKLHSPILIAGLPDSGRVAKIVLDHLVKSLKAAPLGYLHSDYLPPRVLLKPDGTPE